MTLERLRQAKRLMADQDRSIPAVRHELGDIPVSTLYHYFHADGSLKAPARKLPGSVLSTGSKDPAKGPPADTPSMKVRRAHAIA